MKFKEIDKSLITINEDKTGVVSIKINPYGSYDYYFKIYKNPLGNCQIFIIAWFQYFLSFTNSDEFIENLKYCASLIENKNILMVDISDNDLSKLKEYIKDSEYKIKDMIIFVKTYISTNGSKMNIVQLDLKKTILKTII